MFMGIDGIMYAGPIADFMAAAVSALLLTREVRLMKSMDRDLNCSG